MALTTTKGRSGRRDFTMLATRSMALASSTEVPPNFMTITVAPPAEAWASRQQTLDFQQLGVEQRCACRSADGIVRQHGELVIEHAAGTQAADADRHAIAAVDIE